ncbi:hypothetical protein, partial [Desulfobulbus alkaliphilus]|uniref:hypothetical protein n=1 Tax=Desulfobulbus alkaliphilus TaxID=869814 RepID=UPI001965A78C
TFIETSLWYILGELVLDPTVAKTLYSHGGFFSLPDLCIQTLPLFCVLGEFAISLYENNCR